MIGQTVSHYRILEKIGAGGMGEVYLAEDASLDRKVALKFLPPRLQADEIAHRRFLREAKSAAGLDHPYICNIHEVSQTDDGHDFIVMEYVEGLTLQDKLADVPIPLKEALRIATEVAEALEKAHNADIVHRDLKPSNIMLTEQGHAKVMDFGLAKRVSEVKGKREEVTTRLTREGSTLGTLTYMSPEQVRGERADSRSDIFSFGVILYEMLTSVHPFRKRNDIETASAILKDDTPPLTRYTDGVPFLLQHTVRKMLAKDPEGRCQLMHDIKTDLEGLLRAGKSGGAQWTDYEASFRRPEQLWKRILPWAAASLFAVVASLAFWAPWEKAPEREVSRRLSVELGIDLSLPDGGLGEGTAAVLSPDGSLLAFVGKSADGERQVYLRRMDHLEPTPISGTEGAAQPCFSPDGRWIAFIADNKLKKILVAGGTPLTLCDVRNARGIDWVEDGSIVFSPDAVLGLSRISSTGGTSQTLTTPEEGEGSHRWPQVLPGGQVVLFTADSLVRGFSDANIVVERIPSGKRKILWQGGSHSRYLPSGHLVFVRDGVLFAAPFDLGALVMSAEPVPVLEGVRASLSNGSAQFSFANDGTLVYLPSADPGREFTLDWLDQTGETSSLHAVPGNYGDMRLAPDGHQLAMEINDGQQWDIFLYDWERDVLARLTFDPGDDLHPVWSPAGTGLVFASMREGRLNLYWKRSDGTGPVQQLTESPNFQFPLDWHPEGKYLAFMERDPQTGEDIRILPLEGNDRTGWKPGEAITLLNSPFSEYAPTFSPDGRWLAYASNESGDPSVYVRPFPGPGGKWEISSRGGHYPAWSPNGKDLFYRTKARQIWVVSYSAQRNSFQFGKPTLLSERRFTRRRTTRGFDPHPGRKTLGPSCGWRGSRAKRVPIELSSSRTSSRSSTTKYRRTTDMIGQTISHYRIIEKIGAGGMGEVYLAEDTSLDRKVALKFLPESLQDDEIAHRRFLREAKSAAGLDHPFICNIHEVGETEDGQDFIVMEYVEGLTLQGKLADGPLPLKEALRIATEVAEALEKAHNAGIVHRDLKPSNIMLTAEGHAKVMDFGLAKKVVREDGTEQDISSALTREGTTLGTLAYMSPEQVKAEILWITVPTSSPSGSSSTRC